MSKTKYIYVLIPLKDFNKFTMNILQISKEYNTHTKCIAKLEKLRWGKSVIYPYCNSKRTRATKRALTYKEGQEPSELEKKSLIKKCYLCVLNTIKKLMEKTKDSTSFIKIEGNHISYQFTINCKSDGKLFACFIPAYQLYYWGINR